MENVSLYLTTESLFLVEENNNYSSKGLNETRLLLCHHCPLPRGVNETLQIMSSCDDCALPREYTVLGESAWVGIMGYLLVFIFGLLGNLIELGAVGLRLRQRIRPMNVLLFNLCIADIIVVVAVAATEIVWRISIGWYVGDFLCKLVQFFRAFGLYLSSLVLIGLSVDRYYAILHPLKVVDASNRVKLILILAWVFAAILAAPQCLIFGERKHPYYPSFHQCQSDGETAERLNTALSLTFMYFLPFVFILFSYGNIIYTLTYQNGVFRSGTNGSSTGLLLRRSDGSLMDRAKIRALKLTFVIVIVFVLSWTPYVIITTWHVIDRDSAERVNPLVQEALFIMVVANSCANPLVYGLFHSKGRKEVPSAATSAYTMTMSTYNRASSSRRPRMTSTSPNPRTSLPYFSPGDQV